MELIDWLPAITTTGLLLVIWLVKSLVSNRLTKSVQHQYDLKLEHLRYSLQRSNDELARDSRRQEAQIASLQTGALSGLASRHIELDKKRLKSFEEIWQAVTDLGPAEHLSQILATCDYKKASQQAPRDAKIREFFRQLGTAVTKEPLGHEVASGARLFVPEIVWALFSAYRSVLVSEVLRCRAIEIGADLADSLKDDAVNNLVKLALPHRVQFVDQHGIDGVRRLLEELREQLFSEIRNSMNGAESDRDAIDRAREIVEACSKAEISMRAQSPNIVNDE